MSMPDDHVQNDPRIARLDRLRRERDEVQASLPAHSVPPAMLIRLEDLEEQIAALETVITPHRDDRAAD